mmetsp:Transcript_88229/g.189346  ORF Transcript_88229/g.189346 Transcript_88229/m.189346 type:complete len:713 (+) Transcript_88229:110-2248(+)
MSNEGQLDELRSLQAIYENSDVLALRWSGLSELSPPMPAMENSARWGPLLSPAAAPEADAEAPAAAAGSAQEFEVEAFIFADAAECVDFPAALLGPGSVGLHRSASGEHWGGPVSGLEDLPPLHLRAYLPREYLVAEVIKDQDGCSSIGSVPRFELSASWLSHLQLGQLCAELDRLTSECGPDGRDHLLVVWLEWLRVESWDFLALSSRGELAFDRSDLLAASGEPAPAALDGRVRCAARDPKEALLGFAQWEQVRKTWQQQQQQQLPRSIPTETLQICDNCHSEVGKADGASLSRTCGHAFCFKCARAVVQVHEAARVAPCCPIPCCQAKADVECLEQFVDQPKRFWAGVAKQILGTSFQDRVVFCPRCEDLGMDMPVLLPSQEFVSSTSSGPPGSAIARISASIIAAKPLTCHCFRCSLQFCSICRSPCHPGEACMDDGSRALRMGKRRPPLPPELVAAAKEKAAFFTERVKKSAATLKEMLSKGSKSLRCLQAAFLAEHETRIRTSLGSVFSGAIHLTPAPLENAAYERFLASVLSSSFREEVCPAFHGTDARNHDSIFKRGLLIPDDGNGIRVVHGAAHGRGVYTANVDAAWLSKGFCTAPRMLVCAVLQSRCVRHVGDAMVVGDASHVLPLFEGTGESFSGCLRNSGPQFRAPLSGPPATALSSTTRAAAASSNSKTSQGSSTASAASFKKRSKLIARLEKAQNRHR